ncbi:UDP-N-acetylmuramoyl-tripeptide--D-alanyl-D-alanine ligase [bacterium]|nr:UDP-N-acetylmuramoyl-tripeptide--D-alanyl-D-alanine ligase [bacterium]
MSFTATLQQILQITTGSCLVASDLSEQVTGVSTDSRSIVTGNLFIAIRGDTTDGHLFLESVFAAQAAAVIVSNLWPGDEITALLEKTKYRGAIIAVADTTVALGDLAKYWRSQIDCPVFAITGSNGKTTTKEILRQLLSQVVGAGTYSKKSLNNHWGLPLTLLGASRKDKFIVLEAGMNHPGELTYLSKIAEPTHLLMLNVAPAHIGHFASLAEIAQAKAELLAGLRQPGVVIYPSDDANLITAIKAQAASLKLTPRYVTYSSERSERAEIDQVDLKPERGFHAKNIKSKSFSGFEFEILSDHGAGLPASIPHLGRHNVKNALAAFSAAVTAFPDFKAEVFAQALSHSPQPELRLAVRELPEGITLIEDCYNANPGSMRAALSTLEDLAHGKSVAVVLGDMRELGDESSRFHEEIGKLAGSSQVIKRIVGIGVESKNLILAAQLVGHTDAVWADGVRQAAEFVLSSPRPQIILIKGSRGMALEHVCKEIEKIIYALPSA